jgi:DNA-directed RNA polymerase specialized sigma24 family protein
MRAGDREAAATFITKYGTRIRRRIRGKLNPSIRRVFDSQEILSTVGRRLDQYVRSGKLEATSEPQIWSLVIRMANNAVIDKSRVFRRLQQVEDEDGEFAHELLRRFHHAERRSSDGAELELENVLNMFADDDERTILSMWLGGAAHTEIAQYLELDAATVRKRWQSIRKRIRDRFDPEIVW